MCNCEENKCYHISMGCVEPVVANANHYYTKSEVDEKLEDIITSGCCITPEEVDEKIASATSGYATEQWVLDKHYISGVDLSDYATKEYVSGYTYDKQTIDSKIASGGTFDPTQYYTTGQTNSLLDNKLDVSAYTPCDLTDYYTKSETNSQISSATADMATQTWVNSQGFLTEHQSLSAYSTTDEVTNMINQSVSGKQDTLVAGDNITISGNVISSVGSSGATYTAGRGIDITNNVVSVSLPISAGTKDNSIIANNSTATKNEDEAAFGRYNVSSSASTTFGDSGNTLFSVGNGTSEYKHNALDIRQNGDMYITLGNGNVKIQDQLNYIPSSGYVSAVTASRSASTVTVDTYVPRQSGHTYNTINFAKINGTGIVGSTDNLSLATQADFSAHTASTSVHVTTAEKNTWNSKVDTSTLNNYVLKTQLWCGTQAEYDAITTKDANTIYMIHS